MEKKVYAGLDMSLRKTGITILDKNGNISFMTVLKTEDMRGMERLSFIQEFIFSTLKKFKVDLVAIEGYSFNSKGQAGISLGELGGLIRYFLFKEKYEYIEVSPLTLKSYTIGTGSKTEKKEMREAVRLKYGIDIPEDNMCDSFALAKMFHDLGEEMKIVCQSGGMDYLRKKQELKIREAGSGIGFFNKLILSGFAKKKDLISEMKNYDSFFKQTMEIYEYLGLSKKEFEKLTSFTQKEIDLLIKNKNN